MIAWCDGDWIDDGAPAVGATDRGLLLGDGLFETVLWEDERLQRLERHVQRLQASAEALGLPAPPAGDALEATAAAVVARNDLTAKRAAVRITWSAGSGPRGLLRGDARPFLLVSAARSPLWETAAAVTTSTITRNAGAPSARFKTLSYIDNIAARAEAAAQGADEALMLNAYGEIAGGSHSNVFAVIDGRLRTPAVDQGALPGTVRARLLEMTDIDVAPITLNDLLRAEAMALTNALQGVRPVARLDGRALQTNHPLIAG
ncbi:MAG TPA: aminotransferase class IV, partial [Caulobacterales bacterium]|nr:aminotransferase class IV [Caulobacterales bacterium]